MAFCEVCDCYSEQSPCGSCQTVLYSNYEVNYATPQVYECLHCGDYCHQIKCDSCQTVVMLSSMPVSPNVNQASSISTRQTNHGGDEHGIYKSARGIMQKRGNRVDGTQACHGYAEHQYKEVANNPNDPPSAEDNENMRRFVASKENLRKQLAEYNKGQSKKEQAVREAKKKSIPVASGPMHRTVHTQVKKVVDGVYDGRLSEINGIRMLTNLNTIEDKKGQTPLNLYRDQYDLRTVNETTRRVLYDSGMEERITPQLRLTDSGRIDGRSSAVRNGGVLLRNDGMIDGRSSAVRNGDIKFTKSGAIDGRCKAARSAKK
jgi:hypothetical protein